MNAMPLKDLVSTKSAPLQKNATLFDAIALMQIDKISSVVVVDESNRPLGIFTEHDILKTLSSADLKSTFVEEMMSAKLFCVKQNVELHDAYMAMEEKKFRHLIVIDDDGFYLGVVSEGDFLRQIGFENISKEKTLKDLIYSVPLLVEKELTLQEVAAKMHETHKEYALIVEMGLPKALITQREIAKRLLRPESSKDDPISHIAHSGFKALHESSSLHEAGLLMKEHGIHQLVVVNHAGAFVGVIDRHGVLKEIHGAYFELLIQTIENKNGALEELHLIERKLLKEKEETTKNFLKFQTLFNSLPDGCVLLDEQTRAIEFNTAVCEMLGYTREEFASLKVRDYEFLETPEITQKRIEEIVSKGSISFETQHKRKDGSLIDIWVHTSSIILNESLYLMAIFRDISERQRKDEEIEKLQALAKIGTWEWDIQKDALSGSKEIYKIYGRQYGTKLSLREFEEWIHPLDRELFVAAFQEAMQKGHYDLHHRILTPDGETRWLHSFGQFAYDEKNQPIKAYGVGIDISQQAARENTINQKSLELSQAQALAHLGSWRLDIPNNALEWSDETYRLFSVEKGTALSFDTFFNAVHPEDREKVSKAWSNALEGKPYYVEHRIIVNEKTDWVVNHGRVEFDKDANATLAVGTCQLITERKLHEEQLRFLANNDSLTGLANRNFLLAYLKQVVAKTIDAKSLTALLLFDLDRFKDINDSFGHSVGDELLKLVAKRLKESSNAGTLIARLGGDEFALVMEQRENAEDIANAAQKLIADLNAGYKLHGGLELHVGASAGVVLAPTHARDAEELLQFADAALYRAKEEGRGVYRFYSDDLTNAIRGRVESETNLRRAIDAKEFELFYQPQVHIASGRIVGAEALIRWRDPIKGLISPALFIPIAEESGLIGPIGEWVLYEACRQGKEWLDAGHRLTIAVNLSAHQLRHQDILKMVDDALKETGFIADKLELELTESALMAREEEAVAIFHALRAKGVRLAIDDFGTGYSSLSYLKRFPLDVLKIDKSFVDDIPYEADDNAIVSAIIAMGSALGFQILAEGTERKEQIDFLREKGCTMYQGYYKSPPLCAKDFEALLG